MVSKKAFLIWWLGGLAAFAVSLALHAPLAIEAVPGGILDHQAAPDAASVNAIQEAWAAAGLLDQAWYAMVSDIVFIWIYSFGAFNGGRFFRAKATPTLRALGWIASVSAVIFFVTDFGETSAQISQLNRFEGSDALAGIASALGPAKVVSFLVSFGALAIALIVERQSNRTVP